MYRQRVIEEAARLFVMKGVRLVTMDDIAKHIGISKRTIYEHFLDKKELIRLAVDFLHQQKVEENEKIFADAGNVLEALLEMLKQSKDMHYQKKMQMMIEVKRYYPEIFGAPGDDKWTEGVQRIELLFSKGIEEGVFRDNLNPKTSAYMFSEQARILFIELSEKIDLVSRNVNITSLQFIQDLFLNFLRGISTPKGILIIENFVSALSDERNTAFK
jgi:AcrR family transcriptional regulator